MQTNSFIPIAVGPNGEFGSLSRRFLEGYNALPLPEFPSDRPNAKLAAQRSISTKTPFDVLGKANEHWKRSHGDSLFGGTYTAPTPSIWANQQLGLITQTHIANHIKTSLTKLQYGNNPDPPDNDDDDDKVDSR